MLSFLRFLYFTLSRELSQWKVTSADMPVDAVTRSPAMEISQPSLSFCAQSPHSQTSVGVVNPRTTVWEQHFTLRSTLVWPHISQPVTNHHNASSITQHSWVLSWLPRARHADTSCLLSRRSRGSCEESAELHAHLEDQFGKNAFLNLLSNLEKFIPEAQLLLTPCPPIL